MTPTISEYAAEAEQIVPGQIEYIRELMSFDVRCPICCPFARNEQGEFRFSDLPSPLHWSRQFEWPWILHQGDFRPWHRVLDVGGGWSVLKYAMAARTDEVVSVEPDAGFIAKTDESIRRMGFHNIRQVLGDARSLPFPDGSFDRVVCVSVMEHIDGGHSECVRECLRVLRPGGVLLLTADVLVEGDHEGDFHLDRKGVDSLCGEFGFPLPSVPSVTSGAVVPGGSAVIVVWLLRTVKE